MKDKNNLVAMIALVVIILVLGLVVVQTIEISEMSGTIESTGTGISGANTFVGSAQPDAPLAAPAQADPQMVGGC